MTPIRPTCSVLYLKPKAIELLLHTAEESLKIFSKSLQKLQLKHTPRGTLPFDTIILDYNLPDRNGLEVAKEILAISPHQRIIFVSAYVEDTLSYSIKELNIPVEVLQKPVSIDVNEYDRG
jgi:CheY-like chemotaxis protein